MRVLLIQPPCNKGIIDRVHMHEPLALEYLGAGLKADGHEVEVLDLRLDADVERTVRRFQPRVVGLTAYTNQVGLVQRLAKGLKALDPGLFVVVGGHHATVKPADFNHPSSIDLVVVGEGVTALRQIVRSIEVQEPFSGIPGLAFPGSEMSFTQPRVHPALDDLPMPDRSLTARYRAHYFSEWLRPLASIRTSLGCTGRCGFCALWSITGGRYLGRSPEKVVEELLTLEEENVFFCDDESMCDAKRMNRLADRIQEAGVRKNYFLYARADTIARHPELFAKWRKLGLSQVFVGMETFSDARLRALKKGVTTEQQARAIRILEKLDVLPYASFMVDPSFTREDFSSLKSYIRSLGLRYASFSVLTPLPGTELYRKNEKELASVPPELFDFLHSVTPTTLPIHQFYDEYARLYEKAIPLRHGLRNLTKYGYKRFIPVLRLMRDSLHTIRTAHLDHAGGQGAYRETMDPH